MQPTEPNTGRERVASLLLALVYTVAMPLLLDLSDSLRYAGGVLPAIALVGLYAFFRYTGRCPRRRMARYGVPLAAALALMLVFGRVAVLQTPVATLSWTIWLKAVLTGFALWRAIAASWSLLERAPRRAAGRRLDRLWGVRGWWAIAWGCLLLAWLPMFLANYPGTFFCDETTQLKGFATGEISRLYPFLHTLWVGSVVTGVEKLTGSLNAGVATLTALQMLALSGMIVYMLRLLGRWGISGGGRLFVLGWFMLHPVVLLFCKDTVRDVPFSYCVLLLGMLLVDCLREPGTFFASWKRIAAFAAVAFCAAGMRNVGFALVCAVLAVALLAGLRRRPRWRGRLAICFLSVIALCWVWYQPVTNACTIPKITLGEMLSVPANQTAKVVAEKRDELTDEEVTALYAYYNSFTYDPDCADPAKNSIKPFVLRDHPVGFFKVWGKYGLRYPALYVDAFLQLNAKAWYPDSLLDGYCTPPFRVYESPAMYYQCEVTEPAVLDSKLPGLYALQETLCAQAPFSRAPLLSLLFSPAWMLYLLLYAGALLLYRGRRLLSLPVWVAVLMHLATLFGPMVLLRYTLVSFLTVPIALALAFRAARDPL